MRDVHNLRGIDLNLLVVLEALLRERHVSRAAATLNMSQPAVSHALSRLRAQFDDPLLVRDAHGMALTGRGAALREPVARALEAVRAVVDTQRFDHKTVQRRFRLAMSDYSAALILPKLMRHMRKEAPNASLAVSQGSRDAMAGAVMKGEVDLAIGVFPKLADGLHAETLMEEHFQCLLDRANPHLSDGNLALDSYLAAPHVLVSMQGSATEEIDVALRRLRKRRRIVMTLPHYRVAPSIVAGTDLVLTLASRGLEGSERDNRVLSAPPPFDLPTFDIVQIWHERHKSDEAIVWLRDLVKNSVGAEEPHCAGGFETAASKL
ncbi:MAG: LysR family transcriptional regulator [Kiloniellales bacterium]